MVSEAGRVPAPTEGEYGTDILSELPSDGVPRDSGSFDDYVDQMSDSATFDETVTPESESEAPPPPSSSRDSIGSSSGGNGNGNGSGSGEQWNPKKSFLAESPYFSAFVEKEMHELSIVTEVLTDISTRTRSFTKYGHLMADATHKLSLSCRLRKEEAGQSETRYSPRQMHEDIEKRRTAIGPEISDLLGILGETLEEIASAQLTMTKIFDATLSKALESFVQADMRGVNMMKQEAESQTLAAEQMFNKYITGKPTLLAHQDDTTVPEYKHGAPITPTPPTPTPPKNSPFSKLWRRDSGGGGGSGGGGDPALAKAIAAAAWRLNLEEIRLNQATAELKRFQFTKLLLDVKNRRNLELSEGAVASAGAMQNYFRSSLDRMGQSFSMMARIEERQREARQVHQKIEMPVWLERMNLIVKVLSTFQGSTAEASQVTYAVAAGDPVLIDKQTTDIASIEREAQMWEVPNILAKSSRYRRDVPGGVIHEGWLYQKASSMLSLTHWTRRWFMLRKDGIYCLQSSAELKRENTGHSTTKVKICDVVLCTVREVPNDSSGRFRFELIAPRQKPLMLMAPGPIEMQIWINGIRRGVEKQLVHGNPENAQLYQNIGKQKKDRRSTEIAMTVFDKKSPLSMENNTLEGFVEDGSEEEDDEDDEASPLVKMVLAENDTCADCGKRKPDWVSLNLGILVCLECSGVHRSLGVHVSKVRSLTLDTLSESEAKLFLALGNANSNCIWEEILEEKSDQLKLSESDDRDKREKWIKSKYLKKQFLATDDSLNNQAKVNQALFEAAKNVDLMQLAKALALGANVDWKNEKDTGQTPLHACAISTRSNDNPQEWMGIECAELLLQNGANMKLVDHSYHNVLDCAVLGNADRAMVEYLSSKFE